MIEFSDAIQYFKYRGFRFLNTRGPYYIVYFSENSDFMTDKPRLNLYYLDFKHIVVNTTTNPRTYLNSKMIKEYRDEKFIALKNPKRIKNKNIIYETSIYFKEIDDKYVPNTYRNRYGDLIFDDVYRIFKQVKTGTFRKVFFYSVRMDKCKKTYSNRKFFGFIEVLKQKNLFFDDLVLCLIYETHTVFKILIKNREYSFPRIFEYIRHLK